MPKYFFAILILVLLHACDSEKRALKKAKRQAVAEMKQEAKRQNDSLNRVNYNVTSTEFNRDAYENKYLDTLRSALSKNGLPVFLYDVCLDNRNPSYYFLNSETYISLRHNIIQKMTIDEIQKILFVGDSLRLKKICFDADELLQHRNKTTWELLKMRIPDDTIK